MSEVSDEYINYVDITPKDTEKTLLLNCAKNYFLYKFQFLN